MDTYLTPVNPLSPALLNAVAQWADATTDAASGRRADLKRDKALILIGDGIRRRRGEILRDSEGNPQTMPRGFFAFNSLPLHLITAADVKDWQTYLEAEGISAAGIYSRTTKLSSFFEWLLNAPNLRGHLKGNPVILARPKAHKAYQSERVKALTDKQARALLKIVNGDADTGDVAAIRDYALLRFYFATGKRRAEIVSLKWGDLSFEGDSLVFTTRHKGGTYKATEVKDRAVVEALRRYLVATQRWDISTDTPALAAECPLWLRHDRAAQGRQHPVTSHGFVKALKGYAQRAGIGDIHLHQTRHTVARMVGEESGDVAAVQTVLGHANQSTTKLYLDRVTVKQDRFSEKIGARLDLDE